MRAVMAASMAALLATCGGDSRPAGRSEGQSDSGSMAGMPGMNMGSRAITLSATQASLAGVTFAVAQEAELDRAVRAVATALPNERSLTIVNPRVDGWVEVLHADETGQYVQAGQPLLELYAPELVAAQEELLLARRLAATAGGDSLVASARRRLALWGIADQEVAELERSGTVRRGLTIRAPSAGHILEKRVFAGQMVRAGDPLFRLADLSTVWIEPAIFESDVALVRIGQRAEISFDALPGERFAGRVTFLAPELDATTRTLRVRVELPNPGSRIKPMMFGTVRIEARGPRGVTVPSGAILPTGTRDLAFVLRDGSVVPTEVVVGARGDATSLVVDGLAAGDTVVASATFLFDSESQLAAAMAGIMLNMGMGLDMGGMKMGGGRP